jgi:Tol biopolymer transport system component
MRIILFTLSLLTCLFIVSFATTQSSLPEGDLLAFMSKRSGEFDLYLLEVETGKVFPLETQAESWDSSPIWSPDGTKLAFVSERSGSSDVFVYDFVTETEVNISNTPLFEGCCAAWSPDGAQLAYVSHPNETPSGESQIYLWDIETQTAELLPTGLANASNPIWSPDGTRLAVISWGASFDSSGMGLYLYTLDSGKTEFLSDIEPFYGPALSWSPDGRILAFADLLGQNAPMALVDMETGDIRRVGEAVVSFLPFAWSPEGETLVYTAETDNGWELVSLDSASGSTQLLTDNDRDDCSPTFAPDGTRLAFVAYCDSPDADIYLLDLATGVETRLTDDPVIDTAPAWRPAP